MQLNIELSSLSLYSSNSERIEIQFHSDMVKVIKMVDQGTL